MTGQHPSPGALLPREVDGLLERPVGRAPVTRLGPGAGSRSGRKAFALALLAVLAALLAPRPAAAATPSSVVLNEVNCAGSQWVEVVNRSAVTTPLAGWLLTDDMLDRVPVRESHRLRFGSGVVLTPGASLVVSQGDGGFPFTLACGTGTLRLADADGKLADAYAPPQPATAGATSGRTPDGTGTWTATLPTPGAANAVAVDARDDDPAWLFDPLQVTEIDLTATPAALARLSSRPDEYVEARITMRHAGATYGPYRVGLKLKGHATFRTLSGKSAFKVKFGHAVSGQKFRGLKALTLNNMVQDPSMLAEATASLMLQAARVATARVGYAYVRVNGADYGLYADVETVDSVMAKRWFADTRHIYKGDYGVDVGLGRAGEFEVEEGSSSDRSDLVALSVLDALGMAGGWSERMYQVADLGQMTRAFGAEHYVGQWDGYSVMLGAAEPNNYYLHDDLAGRFTLIPSGTDQTWLSRAAFGTYGNGVLMHHCAEDATCRQLYIDALRDIAADRTIATLGVQARAIRAVIAPWRARDPRREQTIPAGEAQADAKIATIEARPAELAAWLAGPTFHDSVDAAAPGSGGYGTNDLGVTGSVEPSSTPVGGTHVWRLVVANSGSGTAAGVVLDVALSPSLVYGYSRVERGAGCFPSEGRVRCILDGLGAPASGTSTAEVVIGTNAIGAGEVSVTARAAFAEADTTPADDVLVLTTSASPAPVTSTTANPRPTLGTPLAAPAPPVAGQRFTLSLPVTGSGTGAPLLTGTLSCDVSLAGKPIRHTESFAAGTARISLVVPATAKGMSLRVKVSVTASGQTATQGYTYVVR